MNIALLHFHLKPGGVATVIRQQAEALKNRCNVLVVTGEKPPAPPPFDWVCAPGIGYDETRQTAADPTTTAKAVHKAIQSRWPNGCDLLHVHNPLLAKNRHFLKILKTLQDMGLKILIQVHDFAEDGRPNAFFKEEYPADCHYAVINSRDYEILLASGLTPDGLHKIFNAASLPKSVPESTEARHTRTPRNRSGNKLLFAAGKTAPEPFALYPVRAIRRKNIGEAILLSLFFPGKTALCITRPPNSAADMAAYDHWKTFAQNNALNIAFEAGLNHDFQTLMQNTAFLITASVTEGFGFCFLEPWIAGKMLFGRKLPDICRDFETRGMSLDHLYNRLNIPADWLDLQSFHAKWRTGVIPCARLFDYPLFPKTLDHAFSAMTKNDIIDFGLLDETSQTSVLTRLLKDSAAKQQLTRLNPFLSEPGAVSNAEALIRRNAAAVHKNYHLDAYAATLLSVYQKVIRTPLRQAIDKRVLLKRFFTPGSFSLLKWRPYDP